MIEIALITPVYNPTEKQLNNLVKTYTSLKDVISCFYLAINVKSKNIVIGFGITEKTIKSLKKADGLVVGSVICKEISRSLKSRQNIVTNVTNIVNRLKKKIQ